MSHITLLQYVTQLQNLGLTQPQINASVQEWKKIHEPKKVEKLAEVSERVNITEEGKIPAVAEKDTTVTAETKKVSDLDSSSGKFVSTFTPDKFEVPKITGLSSLQGFGSDAYAENVFQNARENAFKKQQERLNSVASENEVYNPNDGFEYKFEINRDTGKIDYYQRRQGQKDFVLENNNYAIASIANQFGHLEGEALEAFKAYDKQYKELEKRKKLINKLQTEYDEGILLDLDQDWSLPPTYTVDGKEATFENRKKVKTKLSSFQGNKNKLQDFVSEFEHDIKEYDDLIAKYFTNEEGEIQVYTQQGRDFLNKILEKRNKLAKDVTFVMKIIQTPSNYELRDESGKLIEDPRTAIFDPDSEFTAAFGLIRSKGAYIDPKSFPGGDPRLRVTEDEAVMNFIKRTGREPISITELEDYDYETIYGATLRKLKEAKKEKEKYIERVKKEMNDPENKELIDALYNGSKQKYFNEKMKDFEFTDAAMTIKRNEASLPKEYNRLTQLGLKLESGLYRFAGKVSYLPTYFNETLATIVLDDKSIAALNALPREQRAKVTNKIMGKYASVFGPRSGKASNIYNFLFDVSERAFAESEKLNDIQLRFDTSVTEDLSEGRRLAGFARLSTESLGSAVSLLEASIPYVGIPLLIVGEAGAAQREKQVEGEDLSLALTAYSGTIGLAEGALEVVTLGIARKAFKILPKETKKQATKSILRLFGEMGVDFGKEGASESATLLISELADALYSGDIKNFELKFTELSDTFLIGGAFGAKISGVGAGRTLLNQGAANRQVNRILDNSKFESLDQAFGLDSIKDPDLNIEDNQIKLETDSTVQAPAALRAPTDTSIVLDDAQIKLANTPGASQLLNTQLKLAVSKGEITQSQADAVRKNFDNVQTAVNALNKLGIKESVQAEMAGLMIEQKQLLDQINATKEFKGIDGPQQQRLKEIDNRLKTLSIDSSLSRQSAQAMAEQLGVKFENFTDQDSYDARVKEIEDQGGDVVKSVGYGQAATLNGETVILINDKVAAEDNVYTTDQHEILHPFFLQALKGDKQAAARLGKALMTELINNKDIGGGEVMLARFNQYVNDPNYTGEMTWDEVIPLVSEALSNGDIQYNPQNTQQKNFFEKIKELLQSFFKKNGLNIKFNTGKDVFDFLLDYNNQVKEGKGFTEAQLRVKDEGAQGALVEGEVKVDRRTRGSRNVETIDTILTEQDAARAEQEIKENVAVESKRVEDSQEVQDLYDQQGEAAAFDIIQKFKPITNKIVESRSQAPNFDRQLLTDEIETGERGILDLIRSYNPDSGVPLAAYINKFLPSRAIEASQRVLGEEFTEDVTEARGVATEEVTETVETTAKTRLTKPSSLLPAEAVTEITEQVKEKIKGIDPKNMTFKKLGDLAPEIIAREIGIPVKKLTDPRANLSKGDATAIQQFVTKNADKLLRILPEGSVTEAASDDILGTSTGVPTGLLKAFYTKGKRGTRGAGLTPFIKNKNISKADFLEAFGIVEGKKAEGFSARSPQAQALKGIASLYGRLVTNEVARSPEVDLKPEVKQRVAAGKSRAMASKRFSTYVQESANQTRSSEKQSGTIARLDNPKKRDYNRNKLLSDDVKTFDGETVIQGFDRVLNKFLQKNPKFRNYFKLSLVFGESRSPYGVVNRFEERVTGKKTQTDKRLRRTPMTKNKELTNSYVKSIFEPGYVAKEKAKLSVLKDFYLAAQDYLKNNPKDAWVFDEIASAAVNSQNSPLRALAPALIVQVDENGKPVRNVKGIEEHTDPQNNIGTLLTQAAKDGRVNEVWPTVEASYIQGFIDFNNNNLLDVDFKKSMPELYFKAVELFKEGKLKLDQGLLSAIRLSEAGVNFDQILYIPTKQTFSEYFFGVKNLPLNTQKQLMQELFSGETTLEKIREYGKTVEPVVEIKNKVAPVNNDMAVDLKIKESKRITSENVVNELNTLDNALNEGRKVNKPIKKARIFDFDDTIAKSKSKVIVTMPFTDTSNEIVDVAARRIFREEFKNLPSRLQNFDNLTPDQQQRVINSLPGKTIKITPATFALEYNALQDQGAEFDFSEFEKVIDGKKGPLFKVLENISKSRGTEDIFILTARPASSAGPIKQFLSSLGVDIPIKNITGLGDGSPAAKGRFVASKAAEGYNDFYFADDAVKNVKAVKDVLDQLDVKSKVQQARASKRNTFNTIVNDMIESSSGIESYKTFSAAKARTIGKDKGRFDWLTLSSSAEDFKGLLYRLLGNGKKGEAQYEFLKTNLIDVYNRAEDSIIQAKIAAANDFMALKKQFPGIPKTLETETGVGKFTYQHALRVYMWTQQGMSIPGLSKADTRKLNKFITDDVKLQAFADQLISIQKGKPYPEPGKNWLAGNLTTDIIGGINKVNRAEYQQEFRENVDIIFSPENLNKMEAAYGTRWRKALENSLARMKAGTNRLGYNDQTSAVLDWVNNSVGAVMFLNTRSALLQTISAVNFLNWGDNNIIKAGAAFANQKQYWSDFMFLMNSDYLVQRRNGLKINVSESEIADAVKDSQNKPKAAIAYLLSKGFVFTRYADSFAIATGGSTFYRNRIKKYLKEGMDQKLAEQKAFEDFKDVAEESQQSSDPSKISMQQASGAGRVILNWANTPMQYVRIQKRDLQDLIAGRGDPKVKIARIAYYGVVQNLIFNALQQALFVIAFDDDDEEEDPKKKARDDKRIARVANGMIDSQLKGLGIAGMVMLSAKNTIMKIYEESKKNRPEYEAASIEALSFSPAISSKYRKLVGGLKSFSWNMKEIKEKGFSLDNPAYLAGAQILTAFTNIPIDRVMKKANNIRGILSEQSKMWQKVAMTVGFSTWDIGLPYYGGWDKPVEPTEAERKKQEIEVMKRDTKTADQVQMLLDLGLTKKQIKALRYEDARVKKIIELQNKNKNARSQK